MANVSNVVEVSSARTRVFVDGKLIGRISDLKLNFAVGSKLIRASWRKYQKPETHVGIVYNITRVEDWLDLHIKEQEKEE